MINDTGPNCGSPQGASSTMEQRQYDGTRQRIAYMRFDLSGVNTSLPGWSSGGSLTFDVTSDNRNRTWSVFGVSDSAANNHWNESTLLYYATAAGFSSTNAGCRIN